MEIIEFNGLLEEAWEYDEISIGGQLVSSTLEDYSYRLFNLKYYISVNPIDKDNIVERFLTSHYEGLSHIDCNYIHGSEWTGVYARNDDFKVGEHDINEELRSHIGKYCYLVIQVL